MSCVSPRMSNRSLTRSPGTFAALFPIETPRRTSTAALKKTDTLVGEARLAKAVAHSGGLLFSSGSAMNIRNFNFGTARTRSCSTSCTFYFFFFRPPWLSRRPHPLQLAR